MTKIMIADSHSLMRRAVREVIEHEEDMSLVAEAYSGPEAEALALETQPDVILLDPDIPKENGLELMERMRTCSPNACFVIFTTSRQDQHVFQALQSGAMGYLTKDVEPEDLLHALRCVARNNLCLPGALASGVMTHLRAIWQAQESMTWSSVLGAKTVRLRAISLSPSRPSINMSRISLRSCTHVTAPRLSTWRIQRYSLPVVQYVVSPIMQW
jgi:DNA-binding NarL/FixJ family response regulator